MFQRELATTESPSSSSSGSVELNLPETPQGYKRYIVISNETPKRPKDGSAVVHKEITNSNVDELINDLHQLHKELNDVAAVGNKIMIDCSDCFSCFKNARVKSKVKTGDNQVTTV
jgi:hypothetical protein